MYVKYFDSVIYNVTNMITIMECFLARVDIKFLINKAIHVDQWLLLCVENDVMGAGVIGKDLLVGQYIYIYIYTSI